eukprot:2922275-Pyramimonas_sp.AAC.1
MKALQAEWEEWWQVSHHHPSLVWPDDLGEPPDQPTVPQLRAVLKSFKASTGTGFDQISPRLFLLLPDEALEILCDIIGAIEKDLEWPSAWIRVDPKQAPKAPGEQVATRKLPELLVVGQRQELRE